METPKTVNALLWLVNVVLGAAIIIFAFQYLLFPAESDPLEGMDFVPPERVLGGRQTVRAEENFASLRSLGNPITAQSTAATGPGQGALGPSSLQGVKLKGVLVDEDPRKGMAIVEIAAQRAQLAASVGKDIRNAKGEVVPELRGWTLAEVYPERALFVSEGRREWLVLERAPTQGLPVNATGVNTHRPPHQMITGAFDRSRFRSRLISQTPNRQVWEIDPNEIEYAAANQQSILERDVMMSAYPSGGVKLDTVGGGSIVEARGLKPGDVVQSVNGRRINSLGDVKEFLGSGQKGRSVTLSILRAGRTIRFDYVMGKTR